MKRLRPKKRPKKRRQSVDAVAQTEAPIRLRLHRSLQGGVTFIALTFATETLADSNPGWLVPAYVLCVLGILLLSWSAMTSLPKAIGAEQNQFALQHIYAAAILVALVIFDGPELRWQLLLMTIALVLTMFHRTWREWMFPQHRNH